MGASAAALLAQSMASSQAYAAPRAARGKSFNIVYRLNGGVNPKNQIRKLAPGESIAVSRLRKPSRTGHDFCGWYSDKELTKKARKVWGDPDVALRRIFARWEPSYYDISYVLRGGQNPKKQIRSVRRNKALSTAKLKKPTRRGYAFDGWYQDSKLLNPATRVWGRPNVEERRIYAKWRLLTYKISYKMGGGREVTTLPRKFTVESAAIKPARVARDGFYFDGWYEDAKFKTARPKIKKGSVGNTVLYAHWKPVDYWEDLLSTKCAAANKLANQAAGAASSFVFITDVHVPSNALVFPHLVKQAIQRTSANMVVFGGDAINYHSNRQDAIDMISFLSTAFGSAEFHFVRGNHDANTNGAKVAEGSQISDVELIGMTAEAHEVRVANKMYYHRDDTAHRVRYIMCDSRVEKTECVDPDQVLWLKDRILELDENWTVLVLVHRFYTTPQVGDDGYTQRIDVSGTVLIDALDEVYDSADAAIVGVICGHCHRDFASRPSKKGYPYVAVSTTCDAYGKVSDDPSRERTLHSDDEHAFDIVTLDTSRKMLHLTRVGWGQDRSFSYAPAKASSTQSLRAGSMS